jgi:hypothetical protein
MREEQLLFIRNWEQQDRIESLYPCCLALFFKKKGAGEVENTWLPSLLVPVTCQSRTWQNVPILVMRTLELSSFFRIEWLEC